MARRTVMMVPLLLSVLAFLLGCAHHGPPSAAAGHSVTCVQPPAKTCGQPCAAAHLHSPGDHHGADPRGLPARAHQLTPPAADHTHDENALPAGSAVPVGLARTGTAGRGPSGAQGKALTAASLQVFRC
jgi:hypothetical protein